MDEVELINALIKKKLKRVYTTLPGIITAVKPKKMIAKVKISRTDPYGPLETGWLKIKSLYAGKDYGLAFVPYIGDECVVCFQDKDLDDGFVLNFAWSESNEPPIHDTTLRIGDCLFKHKKGTWILLDKDGNIKIFHKTGTIITINEVGDITAVHNKGHFIKISAKEDERGNVIKNIQGTIDFNKKIELNDVNGNDTTAEISVSSGTCFMLKNNINHSYLQGRVSDKNIITIEEDDAKWLYEIKNGFGCFYREFVNKGSKEGKGELIHNDRSGPCGLVLKDGVVAIIGSLG